MNDSPTSNDSDLRHLLGDAVSGVHPDDALGQIRTRTRRPSAGRWVPITVAAAVATVVVIGGGTWLARHQSNPPAASTGVQTSTAPVQQTRAVDAGVFYVGATAGGPKLFPEERHVTGATASDLQVAVDEELGGSPADPDYRNPFKALAVTADASTAGGVVTIDFAGPVDRPSGMDEKTAQAAVQALVWTADQAASATGPVTFTVNGAPADHVLGIDTSSPVERAGEDSMLAPVLIDSPAQGATVPTQFTVTGRAAAFEANVVWELKQGDTTVRHGFTTAQECCTLAPYSFTVHATPGDYTLVVHDTDESGGEGVGTSQDTKDVTVR